MSNHNHYLYYVIIPLLIGLYAQFKVQAAYRENSKIFLRNGWTGSQVARWILDQNGLRHVRIERVRGNLADHYDPHSKLVRLSDGVYAKSSLAAAGIVAHECGHAIQHAQNYLPVKLRSAIVPVTGIGSRLAVPLVLAGLDLGQAAEKGARQVLRTAALTYVAALLAALSQFLRMLAVVSQKDRRAPR